MADQRTLTVNLGSRSYPILIERDLLGGEFDLATYLSGPDCLIVTNDTVAPLYVDKLRASLRGKNAHVHSLPDGEQYKTLAQVEAIIDTLVRIRANRDTTVIALGGGVVGDMAGFAAASYMRGVDFIQVPTTLLAQVDSSVGGKTGVNHAQGKNLIGAFHQPSVVLIDTSTTATLPEREYRAGLAEVIKHGLVDDVAFLDWITRNMDGLRAQQPEALAHAIYQSCAIKARVVADDEKELGRRAILNFGHTFGHALERCMGYGKMLHGEAVAVGMIMASEVSSLASSDRARVADVIAAAGLPTEVPKVGSSALENAMGMDKKIKAGRIRLVLLDALGKARVRSNYSAQRMRNVLSQADA